MVSISGGYTATQRSGYTEYRVNAGATMTVTVGNGDTFENAHIDITRSGAGCQIVVPGGWWATPPARFTIRNVGVEGAQPQRIGHILAVACTQEALIENCYFGDGTTTYPVGGNWNAHAGGPIAKPGNRGRLVFRRCNASRWVDNAFYLSPPGRPGNGNGNIIVENCYSVNSQISGFRLGTNDTIRNSYAEIVGGGHRCLWVFGTPSADVTVENCQFRDNGGVVALVVSEGATARMRNSAWNGQTVRGNLINLGGNSSNPQRFVPAGCPMSARDAYEGVGSGGPSPTPPDEPDDPIFDPDPLEAVDPDPFDTTLVVRNKTPDDHAGVDIWLNTTDPTRSAITFDYDAHGTDGADITNDTDYAGLVRLSALLTGRDDDPDDPGRFAFRFDDSIAAIRVNGRNFGRSSTPTGNVQIERNGSVLDLRDFPTTPDPDEIPDDIPVVTTGGAEAITDSGVRLNGAVHHMGEYDVLTVVLWVRPTGMEIWPVSVDVATIDQPTNVSQTLPDDSGYPSEFFTAGTRYEYRFEATPAPGEPGASGAIRSFTTQTQPPPDEPDAPEPVAPTAGSIWFAPDPDGDRFEEDD